MLLVMAAGAKTKDEFQWWMCNDLYIMHNLFWSWIVSVAYFACSILFDIRFN